MSDGYLGPMPPYRGKECWSLDCKGWIQNPLSAEKIEALVDLADGIKMTLRSVAGLLAEEIAAYEDGDGSIGDIEYEVYDALVALSRKIRKWRKLYDQVHGRR